MRVCVSRIGNRAWLGRFLSIPSSSTGEAISLTGLYFWCLFHCQKRFDLIYRHCIEGLKLWLTHFEVCSSRRSKIVHTVELPHESLNWRLCASDGPWADQAGFSSGCSDGFCWFSWHQIQRSIVALYAPRRDCSRKTADNLPSTMAAKARPVATAINTSISQCYSLVGLLISTDALKQHYFWRPTTKAILAYALKRFGVSVCYRVLHGRFLQIQTYFTLSK